MTLVSPKDIQYKPLISIWHLHMLFAFKNKKIGMRLKKRNVASREGKLNGNNNGNLHLQ